MKQRLGFVSNSSSSSFLIFSKEPLTAELYAKALGATPNTFLYKQAINEFNSMCQEEIDGDGLNERLDNVPDEIKEKVNLTWNIYTYYASDQGKPLEYCICMSRGQTIYDDLIFYKAEDSY